MADDERANLPEPKSSADQVAAKAAELLDRDILGHVEDKYITLRGAKIYIGGAARDVTVCTGSEISHFKTEMPSAAYRELVMEAWNRAAARKREALLKPIAADIEDEEFHAKREAAAQEKTRREIEAHRRERRQRIAAIAALAVVALIVFWLGLPFFSDEPDADPVNAYGFRKADFPASRQWTYPDGCFPDDNRFSGLPDCKAHLEKWESEGSVWVDWPEEGQP